MRWLCAVAVLSSIVTLTSQSSDSTRSRAPQPTGRAVAAAVRYVWPVAGAPRIVAPFVAPTGPYAPGHRGVDLQVAPRANVLAAADGVVRFAGRVAGRGLVVIAHADGLVTEYEPLDPLAHAGEVVRGGAVIGRVHGTHRTCPPDRCVHWAARRGDVYLDPMVLLKPLGAVRLLPWHTR